MRPAVHIWHSTPSWSVTYGETWCKTVAMCYKRAYAFSARHWMELVLRRSQLVPHPIGSAKNRPLLVLMMESLWPQQCNYMWYWVNTTQHLFICIFDILVGLQILLMQKHLWLYHALRLNLWFFFHEIWLSAAHFVVDLVLAPVENSCLNMYH